MYLHSTASQVCDPRLRRWTASIKMGVQIAACLCHLTTSFAQGIVNVKTTELKTITPTIAMYLCLKSFRSPIPKSFEVISAIILWKHQHHNKPRNPLPQLTCHQQLPPSRHSKTVTPPTSPTLSDDQNSKSTGTQRRERFHVIWYSWMCGALGQRDWKKLEGNIRDKKSETKEDTGICTTDIQHLWKQTKIIVPMSGLAICDGKSSRRTRWWTISWSLTSVYILQTRAIPTSKLVHRPDDAMRWRKVEKFLRMNRERYESMMPAIAECYIH